jgi:hypothetical protein
MTTTASFTVNDTEYIGVAMLIPVEKRWFCYILKNSEWVKGVGYFNTVPECWRAVERELGIGDTRIS